MLPIQHISGINAENLACCYLQEQGLRLEQRNFHTKLGEIDLIMSDKDYIVFIEVRFRKHDRFGSGAESVTYNKQQKIIKTAAYYLQSRRDHRSKCRFDVISISGGKIHPQKIEWIKDAFSAE